MCKYTAAGTRSTNTAADTRGTNTAAGTRSTNTAADTRSTNTAADKQVLIDHSQVKPISSSHLCLRVLRCYVAMETGR